MIVAFQEKMSGGNSVDIDESLAYHCMRRVSIVAKDRMYRSQSYCLASSMDSVVTTVQDPGSMSLITDITIGIW